MIEIKGNPSDALKILYRKRKPILILTAAAVCVSIIFTGPYFIHPYYKSETVIYPAGSNSHRVMIAGASRFGSDKEIDEQIQILKSSEVRDSIIKKYHLLEHYNIDTTSSTQTFQLYRKFEDNITIDRTRYNSISVIVFDTDPSQAADIANDIVKFGDAVKNKIIKRNLRIAFESFSEELSSKMKEIDTLADELNQLSKANVFPLIPFQRQGDLEKFKTQMKIQDLMNTARIENNFVLLELLFGFENKLNRLNDLHESYSSAYIDYTSPVPESYIVNHAEASSKKAGPMRSLMVLIAFAGIFLLTWAWYVAVEKLFPFFKSLK